MKWKGRSPGHLAIKENPVKDPIKEIILLHSFKTVPIYRDGFLLKGYLKFTTHHSSFTYFVLPKTGLV